MRLLLDQVRQVVCKRCMSYPLCLFECQPHDETSDQHGDFASFFRCFAEPQPACASIDPGCSSVIRGALVLLPLFSSSLKHYGCLDSTKRTRQMWLLIVELIYPVQASEFDAGAYQYSPQLGWSNVPGQPVTHHQPKSATTVDGSPKFASP